MFLVNVSFSDIDVRASRATARKNSAQRDPSASTGTERLERLITGLQTLHGWPVPERRNGLKSPLIVQIYGNPIGKCYIIGPPDWGKTGEPKQIWSI